MSEQKYILMNRVYKGDEMCINFEKRVLRVFHQDQIFHMKFAE